ncbi:MAG: hypothetical protein FWC64_09685 [Treponema sp.]|nr:hypothetical protein [Treponema sp.]
MNTPPKKAEHMTSLCGNRMVSKTHGRIAFRGVIDTLEAEVIEAQVVAMRENEAGVCLRLGEVLEYLRRLMSAEVREAPLDPPFLFGMDSEEVHRQSHNPAGSFAGLQLPAYTQGPLAARLNTLRAKTREAELAAVRIFGPGTDTAEAAEREDIILGLNRLSSALWWLFCAYTSAPATPRVCG